MYTYLSLSLSLSIYIYIAAALAPGLLRDFKDTVYPFFESDTLLLERLFVLLFLQSLRKSHARGAHYTLRCPCLALFSNMCMYMIKAN